MNSQSFFGKQYVQVLITLALVGVIAALSSYAYFTIKQTKGVYTGATSINVQGKGEIFAKPDIGTFSFSVLAEGADAKEAITKSAESINAVLASLKEAGVEEKDVKTENYYLNPKYSSDQRPCVYGGFCPQFEPKIIGYEVSQSVTVKVRDLTKAGDLISLVGTKGATNISTLQFTIDDMTAIKAEARTKAIADAKDQAVKLASDLGVRIVRMTGFYENEMGGGYTTPMMDKAMGGAMNKSISVVPSVPTGENMVVSNVTITYEVK